MGDLVERYRKARRDPELALLEGLHALKHALRFGAVIEHVATRDLAALLALTARLAPDLAAPIAALAEPVAAFERLVPVPPATGVVALARRPEIEVAAVLAADGPVPVVLLEEPDDLGNIGAVVRVAAAAGAAAVLTTGRHDPWHPAALRGAAGLHFALPVARVPALPASRRSLVALDPTGGPLRDLPAGAVLAFGSERAGLSADLRAAARHRIAIPMRAGVSSLNLATAVAVMLYAGPGARSL